jgi:hypothetical protein
MAKAVKLIFNMKRFYYVRVERNITTRPNNRKKLYISPAIPVLAHKVGTGINGALS